MIPEPIIPLINNNYMNKSNDEMQKLVISEFEEEKNILVNKNQKPLNGKTIYAVVQFILVITGGYYSIKNISYFVEVWKSLHGQGIATSYLVVSTMLGFWILIPVIFVLPFATLGLLKKEDKLPKLILKSICYEALALLISGLLLSGWFIVITWIHG